MTHDPKTIAAAIRAALKQREEIIRMGYEKYQIEHPDDWQFTKMVMKEFAPTDAKPVEVLEPSP